MEDLKKTNMKTSYFSLDGISTYAKVISVKDGDTIVLVIPFLNTFFKFDCRLNNIDTCEIHSSNIKIKEKGLQAKCKVIELLSKQKVEETVSKKYIENIFDINCCLVWIKCYDFDKYGRLLIDVYLDDNKDKSISDILLEEKLAYSYHGLTKLSEEEQLNILL